MLVCDLKTILNVLGDEDQVYIEINRQDGSREFLNAEEIITNFSSGEVRITCEVGY